MADNRAEPSDGLQPHQVRRITLVLAHLFLYSVAMFTIPFLVFFSVRHMLTASYPGESFLINAWSVGAAVLTVNCIIGAYVYKAYCEEEYDADDNLIDQNVYTPLPPVVAIIDKKSTLNLKNE